MEPIISNAAVVDRLLQLLVQQSQDHAFAVLDPQGVVLGWRGAAERMLGYTEEQAVGQPLSFIFTDEDNAMALAELEQGVARTRGRSEDDRWHVRSDGLRIWVSGVLTPLWDGDTLLGYAKVMLDRTDLRSQIDTQRNRCEQQAQQLAGCDIAFARVAHELRNSLGPVQNAAALLERSVPGASATLAVTMIQRQVAVMQKLVNDLAEAARAGTGKLQLTRTQFDLGRTLLLAAEAVRARATAKRLELLTLLPAVPLNVHADAERIHQVAFNLLDNAVKYTPAGGRIWLKCTIEDSEVVFRVQDTGIGIPAELLPVIFDMFTQESPSDSEGGYGVGLSLVKELVRAHDGVVEVRSQGRGLGSEFAVRLPLPERRRGLEIVPTGPEQAVDVAGKPRPVPPARQ